MISDSTVKLSRCGIGYGCDGQLGKLVNGIAYSSISLKLLNCEVNTSHTELGICHGQRDLLLIFDGV